MLFLLLLIIFALNIFNFLYFMQQEINNNQIVITDDVINTLFQGRDPQERIVNLEYKGSDNFISVIYRDENDQRCVQQQPFYPFLWATLQGCLKLCDGDKKALKDLMRKYHIAVKALRVSGNDNIPNERLVQGYRFMFYATKPLSYYDFLEFFKRAKNPVYSDNKEKDSQRDYIIVTPQEQFLISTGKRFFKGYEDYDDVLKMTFDLETEGLDPKKDRIKLLGVRMNRPFTTPDGRHYNTFDRAFRIYGETKEEKDSSELKIIDTFFKLIYTFRPDIITAHNGENFDWNFIIVRCQELGTSIDLMSSKYFNGESIRKLEKESVLKLGGEVETFKPTIVPGTIVTDSLHAVRRAQAGDSSFKRADLKYSSKYLGIAKKNRVYVPGDLIDKTLVDLEEHYAFNDENGDWYLYDPNYVSSECSVNQAQSKDKNIDEKFVLVTRNTLNEGYKLVSGKYIVDRYLLDDIWECDKVENRLNSTNFLICKILPLPFSKCCTMGTAGQWKSLMMSWSYEHDLAIPTAAQSAMKIGGLSRLLRTGYVDNVIKLDYNSLYPSIILTWGITNNCDVTNVTLKLLAYILTEREKAKGLKKKAGKIVDAYEDKINDGYEMTENDWTIYHNAQADYAAYDKRQSQMKILANSFFGAQGSINPSVYPWKNIDCAERTTSTGRQCLRLMISHFSNLGYKFSDMIGNDNPDDYNYSPIVGDSFTPDTPIFIKYDKSNMIDIVTIEEVMNVKAIKIDELGREYDYSEKDFSVLCRSGWVKPSYIYRHKTDKDIYEVEDSEMCVEVTEDHSLFNSEKGKIKPSEINENTELEYYDGEITDISINEGLPDNITQTMAIELALGRYDGVPMVILNSDIETMRIFYYTFMKYYKQGYYSKKCLAGLQFLRKCIHGRNFVNF